MEIALSLLICLVGLFVYFAAKEPKPQEIGRLMFACGLLAFLLVAYTGHLFTIIGVK